jgi:hypothetical protein
VRIRHEGYGMHIKGSDAAAHATALLGLGRLRRSFYGYTLCYDDYISAIFAQSSRRIRILHPRKENTPEGGRVFRIIRICIVFCIVFVFFGAGHPRPLRRPQARWRLVSWLYTWQAMLNV